MNARLKPRIFVIIRNRNRCSRYCGINANITDVQRQRHIRISVNCYVLRDIICIYRVQRGRKLPLLRDYDKSSTISNPPLLPLPLPLITRFRFVPWISTRVFEFRLFSNFRLFRIFFIQCNLYDHLSLNAQTRLSRWNVSARIFLKRFRIYYTVKFINTKSYSD